MYRLLVSLVLLASAAHAQSTGAATVVGTVTDSSGAIIAGAKVTARNLGNQFVSAGETNSSGSYYIPNLASGNYEIAVEAQGFKRYVQGGLILRIN